MRVRLTQVAALVALGAAAFAQDRAPRETVTATINGKKVSVEYGRPALKGRTIDQLMTKLPEDRVWRTGVDQVTTLTSETDLTIGGKKLPAGKYTMYLHSSEKGDWSLVLNTDQGQPLIKIFAQATPELAQAPWPHIGDYQKSIGDKEVVRAPMKKLAAASPAELFTITLAQAKAGATLTLSWGDQSWAIEIAAAK